MSATGDLVRYVPEGPERDELLGLVRIGLAFRAHQSGRHPGFLHRFVAELVERLGPGVTFEDLIAALQIEAGRRDDGTASPIEHASRAWETLTYHDPRRGRRQVSFGRLRNLLTNAKREKFPLSAKP